MGARGREREREDETRAAFVCYRVLHATGEFMRALVFLAKSGEDDASGAAGAGAERGVELSELAVAGGVEQREETRFERELAGGGPMPPPVMAVMASASKCVQ